MLLNIRKWFLMTCFVLTNFLGYAQGAPALIKTAWFKSTLPKLVFDEKEADAKQIVDRVDLMLRKEFITNDELQAIYLKYDSLITISSKKMSDSIRTGRIDLTKIVVSNLLDSLKEKQEKATSGSSTTEASFGDNPLWGWIAAGVLLITAFLFGWFFFDKKRELRKIESDLRNEMAINKSFQEHQNEQKQKLEADNKKKREDEIAANLIQQKKEQEEVQRKEQERLVDERNRLEKQKQEAALKEKEHSKIEFFLPIPSADRIFSNNNRFTLYQSGRTFYRFFVSSTTDTEAEFELCEEASKFAIDKPQSHIEPACEPTNERDNSAKRIVTIDNGRGKALLDGDIWRVIEKAKIRYDYT